MDPMQQTVKSPGLEGSRGTAHRTAATLRHCCPMANKLDGQFIFASEAKTRAILERIRLPLPRTWSRSTAWSMWSRNSSTSGQITLPSRARLKFWEERIGKSQQTSYHLTVKRPPATSSLLQTLSTFQTASRTPSHSRFNFVAIVMPFNSSPSAIPSNLNPKHAVSSGYDEFSITGNKI